MQAKFVACYGAVTQGIWLKNFISGLLVVDSISRPIKIFCDNNAAMFFSENNKSSKGSKHIEIKYLIVRDLVKNEDIMVKHIDTTNMLADPLTKGLRPITFQRHVVTPRKLYRYKLGKIIMTGICIGISYGK